MTGFRTQESGEVQLTAEKPPAYRLHRAQMTRTDAGLECTITSTIPPDRARQQKIGKCSSLFPGCFTSFSHSVLSGGSLGNEDGRTEGR